MKIAYLDCFSGISGNMLLGALAELGVGEDALYEDMAKLGLTGFEINSSHVKKGALAATLVDVTPVGQQPHRHLGDILTLIGDSALLDPVKQKATAVFQRLGEVEAEVHGDTIEHVHFHEVGATDALVDIVGGIAGLHRLGVERVVCSPLPVARGWVQSSHGPLPLPAPATALLLRGASTYGVDGNAELVTPTGAVIATTLADSYGPQPAMTVEGIGAGAGHADLEWPNMMRVFLGESNAVQTHSETLLLIETNIDDMNPEFYEHIMERLFAVGALDVYMTPIIMKKSRPGIVLRALCNPSAREAVCSVLFAESTTFGLRIQEVERRCLQREFREIQTRWGGVKVKLALQDGTVISAAPEYEDCRRLAKERNIPLRQVYEEAKALAWDAGMRP
jgi:pyridinium-3,5-bisthiocarboxylic acid mononucleotide nickel chelatase